MKRLRYVLWLSALLVSIGLSCQADEMDFDTVQSSDDKTKKIEVTSVPDPGEEGSYEGEPKILKKPPPQHYVEYLRTPPRTWTMNELQPQTVSLIAGSINQTKHRITIGRHERTMPVAEGADTRQVAAAQQATFGPNLQRGIEAKSSPGSAEAEDIFLSNNRGLVDILLVMDNSGSMHVESAYIMRYLPELMKHIWRSDWRLGVVTNDPDDSCSIKTASGKYAQDSTDFALDRKSTVRKDSYGTNIQSIKRRPYYFDLYFHWSDYKWLSNCGYNDLGNCSGSCSSTPENCINTDDSRYSSYEYYRGSDHLKAGNGNRYKYNPLLKYFEGHVSLPDSSSRDNGNEQMLRKLRWALEGKTATGCEGNWARDNATVIAIVVTDEKHYCDTSTDNYCSLKTPSKGFFKFVDNYREKHPFKIYGVLGSKEINRAYAANWESSQLEVFDGYVINYRPTYEGARVDGYFKGLPRGFKNTTSNPLERHASTYNRLISSYGHRPLHLISMAIAEELRNIYSPLSYVPDTGSTHVWIGTHNYDSNSRLHSYPYGNELSTCRPGDTSNQGACYKVANAGQGRSIELVNFGNMTHFDKKVKVTYNHGGTEVSAVPFDTSWQLNFAPDPSSVTVTINLVNGSSRTLSSSDYTISGATLSVDASRVQQLVPEGARITINYQSPVTLRNSFTLNSQYQLPSGASIVPNSVEITIIHANRTTTTLNSTTSGFTFDGRVVSFDAGRVPAAGESFTMSYKYYDNEKDTYSFSRSANSDSSVLLSCLNESVNNSVVDCTHNATNGIITFTNSGQFSSGDVISVIETLRPPRTGAALNNIDISTYDYAGDEEIYIALGSQRCSTLGSPGTSSVPGDHLTVNNGIVELAGVSGDDCVIINSLNSNPNQKVTVHFMEYKDLPSDFLQMDASFFDQHRGKYKFEYWDVTVGGNPKSEFMIQDYQITEIDGHRTDIEDIIRDNFGNNEKVRVMVRLYHAL